MNTAEHCDNFRVVVRNISEAVGQLVVYLESLYNTKITIIQVNVAHAFGSLLLSKAGKWFDFEPFYKSHNEMSETCYIVSWG